SPGAGADHAQTALGGRPAVVDHLDGHAVRGHDVDLDRDAELGERVGRRLHDGPVGVRPHDDADDRVLAHARSSFGVPSGSSPRRTAAAATARRRTSSRSSPLTFTWPSLRPGRTPLPYRLTFASGNAASTAGSASVSSSRVEPMTFAMTVHRAVGAVSPSGRSRTARRCCSNWLVTALSMVQCPELWGRIASSLTSTRGPSSPA